jgi:EAL domain-containing protein (putative c-di-GMP-specific phosphodiesterase class I)
MAPGNQIEIDYVPTVDLRTVRVIGVDALVRPGGTSLNGDGRALTESALELAGRAAGDWWRSGLGLQLSVRLPGDAFMSSEWNADALIKRTLAANRVPAEALRLVLTEEALMHPAAGELLPRLHRLGTPLSVDDFGTGQFAISRLVELPVDELRIDRSFVSDQSDADRLVVRSTIHLAHQIGLQVLAKGVETEKAWRRLRSLGCERGQGPLVSDPLPAREVPAWLASWNQRARQLSSARRVQRRKKSEPEKAPA